MREVTETDIRQLMDAVHMLGRTKPFTNADIEGVKSSFLRFRSIEAPLDEKRRSYNFAVTNFMRQYAVVPDDLYGMLDSEWSAAKAKTFHGFLRQLGYRIVVAGHMLAVGKLWATYKSGVERLVEHEARKAAARDEERPFERPVCSASRADGVVQAGAREVASLYLRQYAYEHGQQIYDFVKRYGIGESTVGSLMDAAGSGVLAHRLYGHHLVYDFPLDHPEDIWDFLEHELSDLFTRQGLPILPGELLDHLGLRKYCESLTHNWNFVNGFDILSATLAIYTGSKQLAAAWQQELSVDSLPELAATQGVGALEFAVALSTANPFLLVGAGLQVAASLQGLVNDGGIVFFRRTTSGVRIEFALESSTMQQAIKRASAETQLDGAALDSAIREATKPV